MFFDYRNITKYTILSRISEEAIFERYLGVEPVIGVSITNPLRKDNRPGCGFYRNNSGRLKFKDFAQGFDWDCFNVVEYKYKLNYGEALIRIAIDFGLISGDPKINYIKKIAPAKRESYTSIRIQRRNWNKKDLEYWKQYFIDEETLTYFNVSPINMAWFLNENGILTLAYGHKENDPAYCYHFKEFGQYEYKIYMPLRSKNKFIHSSAKVIQGWSQLPKVGENLLITKSYKDVMSLYVSSKGLFDLSSIAPMSETIVIPKNSFVDLYNRFDNIATLFDFDKAGIRLMRKYEKEYQLPFYMFGKNYKLAGIKDFSDNLKANGLLASQKLIEQYIK